MKKNIIGVAIHAGVGFASVWILWKVLSTILTPNFVYSVGILVASIYILNTVGKFVVRHGIGIFRQFSNRPNVDDSDFVTYRD